MGVSLKIFFKYFQGQAFWGSAQSAPIFFCFKFFFVKKTFLKRKDIKKKKGKIYIQQKNIAFGAPPILYALLELYFFLKKKLHSRQKSILLFHPKIFYPLKLFSHLQKNTWHRSHIPLFHLFLPKDKKCLKGKTTLCRQ